MVVATGLPSTYLQFNSYKHLVHVPLEGMKLNLGFILCYGQIELSTCGILIAHTEINEYAAQTCLYFDINITV